MADTKRTVDITETRAKLDATRIRLAQNMQVREEILQTVSSNPERQWVISALDNRKIWLQDIIEDCNKLIAMHDEQRPDVVGVLFINGEAKGRIQP